MTYQIQNCQLTICLERSLYSESVIYKCFYWYTGQYPVQINDNIEECWVIVISVKPENEDESLERLVGRIRRDLIDFKLREIVTKETNTIRELLTAKAFSHYEIVNDPKTDITDPVGFDPAKINEQSSSNA